MQLSNSSIRFKNISLVTLAVLIVAMMAATGVESVKGTEFALEHIYHSTLFLVLWGVVAFCGLCYILSVKLHRKPATFCLHVAFVLILAGALTTHLTGVNGELHLREGEPATAFELESGESADLPFSITLDRFDIQYYPGSKAPSGYSSDVRIDGEAVTISMNNIARVKGYRLYQADYDEDLKGSVLAVSRDPWGIPVTYTGYALLLLSMIAYFFQKDTGFRSAARNVRTAVPVTIAVLCLAGVLIMMRRFIFTGGSQLMPVLRTPLLQVHVISIVFSYFLLLAIMVIGIIGLCVKGDKSLKLSDLSFTLLCPAVFLLIFGTFLGAVWANISWGNYWAWDPKETWALITILIYSFPLHRQAGWMRSPKAFHIYCIVAFLSVLFTYFGVNMLLSGMHSYA